jgi:predicted acyl esterase
MDVDMVGDIELGLTATATAADTAWIAVLQDVDMIGGVSDVTAGLLRASVREVDVAASRPGAPVLRCRTAGAVPPHEPVAISSASRLLFPVLEGSDGGLDA